MDKNSVIIKGISYYTKNATIRDGGKYNPKYGVGVINPEIVNADELEKGTIDFFKSKVNENIFKCFNSKYPIKCWRNNKYYNENVPNDVEIMVSLTYHNDKKNGEFFTVEGVKTLSEFESTQEKTFGKY